MWCHRKEARPHPICEALFYIFQFSSTLKWILIAEHCRFWRFRDNQHYLNILIKYAQAQAWEYSHTVNTWKYSHTYFTNKYLTWWMIECVMRSWRICLWVTIGNENHSNVYEEKYLSFKKALKKLLLTGHPE